MQNFGARYENAPLCTLPAKLSVSGLVHEGAAPVLARPAFLYKEGLTAAERGTALHAALQFADLAAAANDLPGEVGAPLWRAAGWTQRWQGSWSCRAWPHSCKARWRQACARLRSCCASTILLRRCPRSSWTIRCPNRSRAPACAVQEGIADAVLVNGDTAEIADYKTDRGKTPEQLCRRCKAASAVPGSCGKTFGRARGAVHHLFLQPGEGNTGPAGGGSRRMIFARPYKFAKKADILVPATKKECICLENTMQKTGLRRGLTTAQLKWIALVLMVLDHIHYFFRVHRRGTAFVFAAGAAFCRAVSVWPDRGLHPHP